MQIFSAFVKKHRRGTTFSSLTTGAPIHVQEYYFRPAVNLQPGDRREAVEQSILFKDFFQKNEEKKFKK